MKLYEKIKHKMGYACIGLAAIDIIQRPFTGTGLYEINNEYSPIKINPGLIYDAALASFGLLFYCINQIKKDKKELGKIKSELEKRTEECQTTQRQLKELRDKVRTLPLENIVKGPDGLN